MSTTDHPMFSWQCDHDGVVVLIMDDADSAANTVNSRFQKDFPVVLDRLEAQRESISGVVLTSAKSTFFAGADLSQFATMGPDAIAGAAQMLDTLKANLRRLELLGRPVVAAINGAALGGGCELSLACHHRIVVDDPGALVGLPEATLGVLPGAGGTVRTVRMFGVRYALDEILLPATRFGPRQALTVGLVDQVVDSPEQLLAAAKRWIAASPDPMQPWDRPGYELPGGVPGDPSMAPDLMLLPARLLRKSRGAPASSAAAILATVVEGARLDFDSAQVLESRQCAALIAGSVSTNIIASTFFEPRQVRRSRRRPAGQQVFRARSVLVVGAGPVAIDVAQACAAAGIDTTITDAHTTDAEAAAAAVSAQLKADAGRVNACRLDAAPAVDVIVESVFGDAAERCRRLAAVCSRAVPDTLVVSNSSALPISKLGDAVPDRANLAGMHFFTPVDKMDLLEIVEAAGTSADALERAIDFASQLGKTSVVVSDVPGFYTTRILHAYLDEAMAMLTEGIPPASIERAASRAGFPIGPLALVDELSIPVLGRIDEEIIGDGERGPSSIGDVLRRMSAEFGRGGRGAGVGFYDYRNGKRATLWTGLVDAFGSTGAILDVADLADRLLVRLSLEAVRARAEGVVRADTEANVASVLGIAFPAALGGALRFVEHYEGGRTGFLARCSELADVHGDRFRPVASPVTA